MSSPLGGVVLWGTGGVWRIHTESGTTVEASLPGKLKQDRRRGADAAAGEPLKLAVGDRVTLESAGDAWVIAEILPRKSAFSRAAPGDAVGERVLAANVDQVVVAFAAANPEPHLRMLDRFLAIAEGSHLTARVVVNKVDVVGEEAVRARFADYVEAGYALHLTSARRGDGLRELTDALVGRTSVFTGPSGVGKSTLLNAIVPGLGLRVGEISASVNKGRHTTVGAVMVPLDASHEGYVIDTPGLREVGLSEIRGRRLDTCFPEFRAHAGQCRFQDCRHVAEPDCAVRLAVHSRAISAARYESYVSLLGPV